MRINKHAVALCIALTLLCTTSAQASHSWYLIEPPIFSYKGKYQTEGSDDPLNVWMTAKVFDSADQCTRELNKVYRMSDSGLSSDAPQFKVEPTHSVLKAMADAQCVASDDPRLVPTSTRWQLMYPPVDPQNHQPIATPLSRWYSRPDAYISPSQCEMAKRVGLDNARRDASFANLIQVFEMMQCVATNDPRPRGE
jgi:hypothetical protein